MIQGALWLLGKDGKPERQLALPQGYKLAPDQAPAPYDPEGTDMIPSRLQGCVYGLKNKHIKKESRLADMPPYKVQRYVLEQGINAAYSVKVEQEQIERRAHLAARKAKDADELAAAVAMVNAAISDGQVRIADDGSVVEVIAREGGTR